MDLLYYDALIFSKYRNNLETSAIKQPRFPLSKIAKLKESRKSTETINVAFLVFLLLCMGYINKRNFVNGAASLPFVNVSFTLSTY